MKQHKWHKEIKAWADGAKIEYYSPIHQMWLTLNFPDWENHPEYRIKPQESRYKNIVIDGAIEIYNIKKEKLIEKLETDVEFNSKVFAIYNEMYEPPIPEPSFKWNKNKYEVQMEQPKEKYYDQGFGCYFKHWKSQPKEPQYLYVYADDDNDVYVSRLEGLYRCIGKIKLENENAS